MRASSGLAADLATKQKEVDALRASSRRGSALSASCGDCAKTEEIENGGSADNEAEERREREDEQDRLAQLLAANVEINLLQRELEALKEEVREVKDERGGLQESLKKVQEQKEKAEATVASLKAEMEAVAAASPAREGRVEPLEARRESDLAYWQSQLAERDHRIALLTSERNALSYRLQLKTVGGDAEKKGRETNEKRLGGDAQRERESPRDAEAPRASELQDLEAGEELFEENPRASLRGREEKRGALVATARKAGRVARHVKLYARAIWGDLRSGGCTPWKAKSWQPIDRPFKDFSRVLADSGAHRLAFYLYFLLLHVLFFFRLFFPPLGPAAPCSGALSSDVASFGAVPTLHPPSPPS
ncbi:putative transmembrane protein [Toxoplasma gondii MAS]|uniref:Putative transmembrane protein n=1 Tax=Toxoplasma gondii MAS TaxID=943118 RepID=A0A086PU15_TOXGO|nr:putative transmembrane protein [Toxoplasma gondii MAS]